MAKVTKEKAEAKANIHKQTNSTNKLTGNNKRIQPISPGKKRKAATPKPTSTKAAATPITPSTKLTPPLKHYPIFLLAHQLPNFNETIAKAKQSPFKYQSEKKKTENILVSLFMYQYKLWYKSQFSSIENPNPIPKPIGQFTLITEYQYSSNYDHDNISFAKKYILDALQQANIIHNDNHSYISSSIDITKISKGGRGDVGADSNFITIHLVPQLDSESILKLI